MAATNKEVWQFGTVVSIADVATDTRRIVLEVSNPAPAQPGSHVDIAVVIGGHRHIRSYSIVESLGNDRQLAITVFKTAHSRGGSVRMHQLTVGDRIELTQPLQNFPLRVGARRYVLVAGGIGITAVLEMARVLKQLDFDYQLVYVGRSRSAMAYLELLQQVHGCRLTIHVDDENTSLDVGVLIEGIDEDTELYVCGPIRLMDAVRCSWGNAGLPAGNLRYETFGNSGWFDAVEFIVRIPRLEVEARVGAGESMLHALEHAGVDMMSDCRKGECGLCEVKLLEVNGTVDHRDVFYSAQQRGKSRRMCCCVSRITAPGSSGTPGATPVVTIDVS
ncbi:oxidoreductase [Gordonia sp. TBRC 11910]|uniref:Oxidoreductase n=1 Tax=Gordonia asplenii TaxID=2725283 RepID=A0A848KTG3_9ACTN|nr:PDR/VanB family oxidoreductase [Gordonia asplenii]NMO01986.1 oxidoreductase [Gordonia asplenii]